MERVDELQDFELQEAEYQTQLRVYNNKKEMIGVQPCACHSQPMEATEFAEKKAEEMEQVMRACVYNWDGEIIAAAEIVVETIVQVDGQAVDSGIIFKRTVFVEGSLIQDEKV